MLTMSDDAHPLGRLPNGHRLYRQAADGGCHIYLSDEIGGGVVVWDTSTVERSTLLAAVVEESRREREALREETRRERAREAEQHIENRALVRGPSFWRRLVCLTRTGTL